MPELACLAKRLIWGISKAATRLPKSRPPDILIWSNRGSGVLLLAFGVLALASNVH